MKTSSLIHRAILSVLLIESLCALALVCTAVWHERRTRLRALDITLEGRSDSLIGAVQDAEDPEDRVKVDPAEFRPPSADVYAVYSQNGVIVGSSDQAPRALIGRGADGYRDATADGHHYRVLQREALRIIDREETGGVGLRRPVTVLYAIGTDHIWHQVLESVNFYIVVSIGLLFVTAIMLIYLLRRLLEPLKELAAEAAGIRANELVFRAPASTRGIRELQPLADALSQSIASLRHAFEMQHRFINDAAHELKTAVAVVRSTVQVLTMRTRTQDEYQLGLNQVLSDNDRVEELVSRMLTLARFGERSQTPLVEIDLAEHVQHTLMNLNSVAEARGVLLKPSLATGIKIHLPADAAQILVSNLVMNAIQHSSTGAEVRVTVRLHDAAERPAVLEVQDFGSGIAAENLPHVFDRFFREDPSRSRETGGAGLGLAICKSIVENADGSIELQSQYGRGTTVIAAFKLP
jgi:signal transduction histidine kinase